MKFHLLFLILIMLMPLSYSQITGVITSDLKYSESGNVGSSGEISKISKNYYRFEKFMNSNESFEIILPHDIKIISNKSYGFENVEYYEDFKRIKADKDQEVLIIYFSKKIQEDNLDYGLVALVIVLVFCVISIIVNILIISHLKQKYQKIQIPSQVLSKEEKELYDCIKENEGKNQKEIGIILNWSKARVSSLTNNLADKELIRKERFGRVYKLYIINEVIEN